MRKYELEELKKICSTDDYSTNYPELEGYSYVLDYFFRHVPLFKRKHEYKKSYLYLSKLLEILERIPYEELKYINDEVLYPIQFDAVIDFETLYAFECVLFPKEMEQRDVNRYVYHMTIYFWRLINSDYKLTKLNNLNAFIVKVFDGINEDYIRYEFNRVTIGAAIAYLYARQDKYSLEDIKNIIAYFINDVQYYNDVLITLTGLEDSYNLSYDWQKEGSIPFYLHLDDMIDKIMNGKGTSIK